MLYATPSLTSDDEAVLEALDTMRSQLRANLMRPRRWMGTIRRQLKARAVRGSNSIEGIDISDDDALALVGDEDAEVSVDKTWLAVKGYADAMTYCRIFAREATREVDESMLRAVHFMVQGYDLSKNPGLYRPGDIFVTEEETGRRVYQGPDADEVSGLMAEFVDSVSTTNNRGVPPIIQGAMAHLNLVMIHPFSDGNGRMARILQSLMLYRDDIEEAAFVSVEEYLGRNTRAYYDNLAEVGRGTWSPTSDANPWIEFTLTAHYRQARTVQRRMWFLSRVAEKVDELIEQAGVDPRCASALETAFSGWPLRNSTYRGLTGVSANSASRDLGQLVDVGILERLGRKRGTSYVPASAHRAWASSVRTQADERYSAAADPYRLLRRGESLPIG